MDTITTEFQEMENPLSIITMSGIRHGSTQQGMRRWQKCHVRKCCPSKPINSSTLRVSRPKVKSCSGNFSKLERQLHALAGYYAHTGEIDELVETAVIASRSLGALPN